MEFKNWLFKSLAVSGISILILVILVLVLGSDLAKRAEKIKNRRLDLAVRLQTLGSLAALRIDSQKAEKLLINLQETLPSKDQLIGFSKTLESIAKNNKLGFGFSFGPEQAGTESSPGTNYFNLTGSGSYGNFINFFKSIERGRYFVGFDSVDLITKGKDFELVAGGKVFSQ